MNPSQQQPSSLPSTEQPSAGQVVSSANSPIHKPKNKVLPFLIIAGVELLIIIGLAIVVAMPKTPQKSNTTDTTATVSQEPKPATVTSTQQTSDSISQDLSTLSDDRSFPPDKLSDSSLGL